MWKANVIYHKLLIECHNSEIRNQPLFFFICITRYWEITSHLHIRVSFQNHLFVACPRLIWVVVLTYAKSSQKFTTVFFLTCHVTISQCSFKSPIANFEFFAIQCKRWSLCSFEMCDQCSMKLKECSSGKPTDETQC